MSDGEPVDVRPRKYRRCKHERPGQLLAAGLELFAARGFAATRLADVGRRAGVTPGTVCIYFPTKEALFLGVVRHYMLPEVEGHLAIVTGPGSPRERLIALLRSKTRVLGQPHMAALAKLVMAEIGNFPEVARAFTDTVIEPSCRQVAQLIEAGVRAGEFRPVDPRVHARLLLDPIAFDAIWRIGLAQYAPQLVDRQTWFDAYLDLVLRGLDPEPAGVGGPNPVSEKDLT